LSEHFIFILTHAHLHAGAGASSHTQISRVGEKEEKLRNLPLLILKLDFVEDFRHLELFGEYQENMRLKLG
jgi:hypothetical protein